MTKPQLTAHYFTGKREARKIAAERGAECWNF